MGGVAHLDIWYHLLSHRWSLLQEVCMHSHPWIEMARHLLEQGGITQELNPGGGIYWIALKSRQSQEFPLTHTHSSFMAKYFSLYSLEAPRA